MSSKTMQEVVYTVCPTCNKCTAKPTEKSEAHNHTTTDIKPNVAGNAELNLNVVPDADRVGRHLPHRTYASRITDADPKFTTPDDAKIPTLPEEGNSNANPAAHNARQLAEAASKAAVTGECSDAGKVENKRTAEPSEKSQAEDNSTTTFRSNVSKAEQETLLTNDELRRLLRPNLESLMSASSSGSYRRSLLDFHLIEGAKKISKEIKIRKNAELRAASEKAKQIDGAANTGESSMPASVIDADTDTKVEACKTCGAL